ncbi:MAG: NAD(P)H-binding protein, partial [Hyphomicrobiales bacterium]|nr:NAD(P)H-binding protein [Hyphomicrobiales bacterium]
MKLLLLGATGRTGRRIVDLALARGHSVTAVVLDVGAFQSGERLQAKAADPRRADELAPIMAHQDIVISC